MKRYVSPAEYQKLHPGIGIATIKRMIKNKELPGYIDQELGIKIPHYHILIDDNVGTIYSEDYVKKLEEENASLRATIMNASKILVV